MKLTMQSYTLGTAALRTSAFRMSVADNSQYGVTGTNALIVG
jgi:hypothetical protein